MWKKVKKNTVPAIALTGLAAAIGAILRAVTIPDTARIFTIPAGFCVGLVLTTACLLVAVLLQNRTSSRRPRRRSKRFQARDVVYPVLFTAIAALPGALLGLSLAVFMPIGDALLHLAMPSTLHWIASGAVYGVIWGGCVLVALVLVALLRDWRKSRR